MTYLTLRSYQGMKLKNQKNKEFLHISIDSIEYNEKDMFVIKYSVFFKGKKVLEGEYELAEMPELEDELNNMLLKEITAVVKNHAYGVKH